MHEGRPDRWRSDVRKLGRSRLDAEEEVRRCAARRGGAQLIGRRRERARHGEREGSLRENLRDFVLECEFCEKF